METKKRGEEQECCPKFDSKSWDGQIIEWGNKRFVKESVFTLFYMPINFGGVIRKLDKDVRDSNAKFVDNLCLSDHTSKWNMDIYLAVDTDIPERENITISGKFISKVFEGSYRDTGKWCDEFDDYVKAKDLKIEKQYMWYTTCPKCAKKYGENYVVIVGEIKE